jgi:hypothetical protein
VLNVIMLSVVVLNVIMLSVIVLNVIMLSVVVLNIIMLSVVVLNVNMLSVFVLNVIRLSVVVLNVIRLSVMAPFSATITFKIFRKKTALVFFLEKFFQKCLNIKFLNVIYHFLSPGVSRGG